MAPTDPPPGDIKLEDIDFEKVKECKNFKTIKTYIKLLEDDGSFFEDLLRACKNRLLELNPKEYYILYPRLASEDEVAEATRDIFEWEAVVKETDATLKKSRDNKIFDDGDKVAAPIRGQEPTVARPNLQQAPGAPNFGHKKAEDVYARDKTGMKDYYAAWDKVDVDALENELDEEERRQEESRRLHFEELREQQQEAHRMTPVEAGSMPAGVPEAHRRHLADCEKEKGNEAFYAKDWEEAEAYYSRSLHFRTDDPSTWANRALVRLKRENASGALHDCDRALEINPRYVKALHRRGKALHELKRYEEAVRSFQLAMAESPGNTQINGDLMLSRRHLRDPPPAAPPGPKTRPPVSSTRHASGVVIEELDDDNDGGGGRGAARAERSEPAAGYTRVAIEEDSDSEEEGDDAPASAAPPAALSSSSGSKGFTKVAIEEVSGSEDEAEPEAKAPAPAPQPTSDRPAFQPPPRPAAADAAKAAAPAAAAPRTPPGAGGGGGGGAAAAVCFDDMD